MARIADEDIRKALLDLANGMSEDDVVSHSGCPAEEAVEVIRTRDSLTGDDPAPISNVRWALITLAGADFSEDYHRYTGLPMERCQEIAEVVHGLANYHPQPASPSPPPTSTVSPFVHHPQPASPSPPPTSTVSPFVRALLKKSRGESFDEADIAVLRERYLSSSARLAPEQFREAERLFAADPDLEEVLVLCDDRVVPASRFREAASLAHKAPPLMRTPHDTPSRRGSLYMIQTYGFPQHVTRDTLQFIRSIGCVPETTAEEEQAVGGPDEPSGAIDEIEEPASTLGPR